MESAEKTDKLLNLIATKVENGEINNDSLVQIIELCGAYLNLKSISDYARENHMSYNGVKKFRNIKVLFNNKFVVDNK